MRPRVLFITCHLPYPPLSGGRRRELELIRRLARTFDVQVLAASKTLDQDRRNACELERLGCRVEVFSAVAPEGQPDLPHQVARHRCPPLARRVLEIIAAGTADLVHVEGFYLMQHLPPRARIPVLLTEQNVEYELWRQRALRDAQAPGLRDWRQYALTSRAETEAWRRADAVAAVTAEDAFAIATAIPEADVRLVPDGADHVPGPMVAGPAARRPEAPLMAFISNFAYGPNVDAARYLCGSILPRVADRVPDVRLWLVGNAPPPEVSALADERVEVVGRVPDVVPYIDAADVVACPLRIGGGVKVKAIEAIRRGKALVATSIGMQGLPLAARRAAAVADEPPAFAAAVSRLLMDDRARDLAEARAGAACALLPTWDEATAALEDAYSDLLRREASTTSPVRPQRRVTSGADAAVLA